MNFKFVSKIIAPQSQPKQNKKIEYKPVKIVSVDPSSPKK